MKHIDSKFIRLLLPCFILVFAAVSAAAQGNGSPELSVADFRLGGDEEKTRTLLQSYAPRYDERGQPQFFFYHEYGTQVMSLTGLSKERPYLIVAIDVYTVGETYQKKHFQMKDRAAFISESGFFIGARPSATSLIFAIPNVTRPGEITGKKGAPDADEKDGKVRTLRYRVGTVGELEDREASLKDVDFGAYTADYRFYKNKLSRYTIAVETNAPKKPRL